MGKARHKKRGRKLKWSGVKHPSFDFSQLQHTDTEDCPLCKVLAPRPPAHQLPGGLTAHLIDDDLLTAFAQLATRKASAA